MHQGKYVFSQITEVVRRYDFNQCVSRYHGEYWVKNFSCWEQFLALVFGQLSFRESLRDIAVCLGAHREKLYHLGFRSPLVRTTLAYANENRDWRIYRDYAELLIKEVRTLYANDASFNHELNETVYVLDSTTVELCLTLFSWARISKERATLKLNLGLDLKGDIPAFFHISDGKYSDVEYLDALEYEAGSYYVMDRGYIDFTRLFRIHEAKAFFVTRSRKDIRWKRLYSNPVSKRTGVRCDQTVRLSTQGGKKHYPEKFRRIKYFDAESKRAYVFITNDFTSSAGTIAELYKNRWRIELFFKWIKQHLSIKVFWGRSLNAVKTQICVALCAYLLVAIMKKKLKIERNSYEILQILSVSLFDKTPVFTLISEFELQDSENVIKKQANLWGY
jgi:transposase